MKIEAIRKKLDKTETGQIIGPFEIALSEIRTDPTMQVRDRLDKGNLSRLRSAYRAGSDVPPLLLALVDGDEEAPIVIDGHHRFTVLETLAAEAELRGGKPIKVVMATVVKLSREEARWRAALANNAHGLQLKPKESQRVFATYVLAGQHRTATGFKSYREIGRDMGRDHKTIHTWMKATFPAEAAKMEKPEKVTEGGEGPPPPPVTLLKHEIEAWLLDGRNMFEKARSGGREIVTAGMEKLLFEFREHLARADWDGHIPGLDLNDEAVDLPPDVYF